MSRRTRRVFLGLVEVAGYLTNLQQGLEDLGIQATAVDAWGHRFDYRRVGLLGRAGRLYQTALDREARSQGRLRGWWRFVRVATRAAHYALRMPLFAWAALRYDAFIFTGESFLPRGADLPILRLLRKRMVWIFTGTDHRPPYLNGKYVRAVGGDWDGMVALTRIAEQHVRWVERHVDEIVALPASSHFHHRPLLNFLAIGVPTAVPPTADTTSPFRARGVRVLHSPSDPEGKGTAIIRDAISRLRAEGVAVDYVEISGRPHAEVAAALAHCDFIVDEVYSDTPMAAFAAEAAARGKPALVAGYYAPHLSMVLRKGLWPPALFTTPDQLSVELKRLATDADYRRRLGERACRFVQQRWSAEAVARRYLQIVEGTAPSDWRWDPRRQDYLLGWGLPADAVMESIRATGRRSRHDLRLEHLPLLLPRVDDMLIKGSPERG